MEALKIDEYKQPEMMVVGCMMNDKDQLSIGCEELTALDFYYIEHQVLFAALFEHYKERRPVELPLLCEYLKRKNRLDTAGGIAYMMQLIQMVGVGAYIQAYIKIVKENAQLRKLFAFCDRAKDKAAHPPEDIENMFEEFQKELAEVSQNKSSKNIVSLSDLLNGQVSYVDTLQKRRSRFSKRDPYGNLEGVVTTNYYDLDKLINGMANSNLIILAARPAMGKTALAINIAENVCFQSGKKVGVFSLEMSSDQIVNRIICSQTGIVASKLQMGDLSEQDVTDVCMVVSQLKSDNLIIDDQSCVTITAIRSRARRMKQEHNIDLLIIDYMQLISGSGTHRSNESRQNEISEISRNLKMLAKELDIPILCLSQLSRKVEERQDKRPLLSDLRESGSIEQDADIVLFLLRHDYYDPSDQPGLAELIVAKNRHGSTGTVTLYFQKERSRFQNYSQSHPFEIVD